jgi:hypothetical protein
MLWRGKKRKKLCASCRRVAGNVFHGGIEMANDEGKKAAEMSKERGRVALKIKDPSERREFIALQGREESKPNIFTGERGGYTPELEQSLRLQNRAVAARASERGPARSTGRRNKRRE